MALTKAYLIDLNRTGPGESDAVLDNIVAVANATVTKYAPAAPEAVKDEAAARFGSWLLEGRGASVLSDRPGAEAGGFRKSGAQNILFPWVEESAGVIE